MKSMFVSSTFKDMQAERDILTHNVIPELNVYAKQFGENIKFVDLRWGYTSKLLANGAAAKDVQELLGHSDINTTLNIYAHATRESKRASALLLDV